MILALDIGVPLLMMMTTGHCTFTMIENIGNVLRQGLVEM